MQFHSRNHYRNRNCNSILSFEDLRNFGHFSPFQELHLLVCFHHRNLLETTIIFRLFFFTKNTSRTATFQATNMKHIFTNNFFQELVHLSLVSILQEHPGEIETVSIKKIIIIIIIHNLWAHFHCWNLFQNPITLDAFSKHFHYRNLFRNPKILDPF